MGPPRTKDQREHRPRMFRCSPHTIFANQLDHCVSKDNHKNVSIITSYGTCDATRYTMHQKQSGKNIGSEGLEPPPPAGQDIRRAWASTFLRAALDNVSVRAAGIAPCSSPQPTDGQRCVFSFPNGVGLVNLRRQASYH